MHFFLYQFDDKDDNERCEMNRKEEEEEEKRKKRAEVHIELKFSVFLSRQPPRLGDLFITKLLKCSRGSDEERALRRTRREEKKEQRNQRK